VQPTIVFPALPQRPTGNTLEAVMYDLADALHYPVDSRGRVYDVRFMTPALSYHLARCGWRWHPELAVIKPRRLPPTPGVVQDAVEWVALDAPDSIDDELAGVTIDDVDRLSPAARAELIRRLGGDGTAVAEKDPDLDAKTLWHVETTIHFDDDQEQN
jgi:hypothetical protein